jgi:predicted amidohydrolase
MGGEVPIVESATAQLWAHDIRIDEGMKARLRFCEGRVEGEIVTSYVGNGSDGFLTPTAPGSSAAYASEDPAHPLGAVRWDAEVTGTAAQMRCTNFGVPHRGNRLLVVAPDGTELLDEVVETDPPGYSTYDLMVLAFCAQVRKSPSHSPIHKPATRHIIPS